MIKFNKITERKLMKKNSLERESIKRDIVYFDISIIFSLTLKFMTLPPWRGTPTLI